MEKHHNIFKLIWNHPYVILLVLASGYGEFQFGYHSGIINGALILLKEEFSFKDGPTTAFIRNAVLIGAIAGSVAGGILGDLIGRKICLAAGATLTILGSCLSGVDPNLATISMGRFLIGVGIGMGTVVSPILIAESSPPESRAQLITAFALLITLGQFCAYFVTMLSTKVSPLWSWRTRFGFGSVVAIIQVALISKLHESPVFLAKKGKFEESRQSIKKTHSAEEVEIEVERLKMVTRSAADKVGQKGNIYLSLISSKLLWSCVLLQVAQQAVGIDYVISSAAQIIQLGGIDSNRTVIDLALIVSACSFVGFVGCIFVGDKIQRTRQLMASFTIVMFAYIAFSWVSYDSKAYSPPVTISSTNCSALPPLNNCYNCLKKQCGFCANVDTKEKLVLGKCLDNISDCTKEGENHIFFDLGCPNRTGFFAVIVLGCLLVFGFPTICTTPVVINSEVHDFKNRSFRVGAIATVGWLINFMINIFVSPNLEGLPAWSAFMVFGFSTLISLLILNFLVIPDLRGKWPDEVEKSPSK